MATYTKSPRILKAAKSCHRRNTIRLIDMSRIEFTDMRLKIFSICSGYWRPRAIAIDQAHPRARAKCKMQRARKQFRKVWTWETLLLQQLSRMSKS